MFNIFRSWPQEKGLATPSEVMTPGLGKGGVVENCNSFFLIVAHNFFLRYFLQNNNQ